MQVYYENTCNKSSSYVSAVLSEREALIISVRVCIHSFFHYRNNYISLVVILNGVWVSKSAVDGHLLCAT